MTIRRFSLAVLICGTLDIAYAIALAVLRGGRAENLLLSVAAGPFGRMPRDWGPWGPLAGLGVHFALMAVMVLVYVLIDRQALVRRASPWLTGGVYGLALYIVMYWIVLPLRWPQHYPTSDPASVAEALFAHIVLVGLPLAWVVRGAARAERPS